MMDFRQEFRKEFVKKDDWEKFVDDQNRTLATYDRAIEESKATINIFKRG
jgi:hypothetical protein